MDRAQTTSRKGGAAVPSGALDKCLDQGHDGPWCVFLTEVPGFGKLDDGAIRPDAPEIGDLHVGRDGPVLHADREHSGFRLEIVEQGKSFPDIGQETPQKHLQGKLDGPDTVVSGGKRCTVSGDPVGIDGARILEADDFHDAEHIDVEVTQHLVQRPGLVMLLDELKPRRELAKLRMAISAERVEQKCIRLQGPEVCG